MPYQPRVIDMDKLESKLRLMLAEACGMQPAELVAKRRFLEYGLDSVRLLEVVSAIEEAFDLTISDEISLRIKTLEDLTAYVKSQVTAGTPE
jgi:acyl carrier protein